MTIARGCAFELARFGLMALLYKGVLAYFFPGGGTTLAALVMAVFATFLLNALTEAFLPNPDRRAVERALAGAPPEQGVRLAVSGTLVPIESLLTSPIGQEPCVAYDYWIGERTQSSEAGHGVTTVKHFRGFASVPCALRTSRLGDIRLRGIAATHLEAVGERRDPGRKAHARAREFVAETSFELDPGHSIQRIPGLLKRVFSELANPQLATRYDFADPDSEVEPGFVLSETVLREGRRLTAIGRFRGDGPELSNGGVRPLTLVPGDLERALEALEAEATASWPMALAMFILAHVMLATAIHGGAFE